MGIKEENAALNVCPVGQLMVKLAELVIDANDLPPSRERSCVLTKLDEARHWLRDIKEKTND